MKAIEDNARVYVGTYAKFNAGNLAGEWIDLDDFADEEDFLAECRRIHADEADPEFMFQDFEGFPREFYGESGLDSRLWGWLSYDEDDRAMVKAFVDAFGDCDVTIDTVRDAYCGTFDSVGEFVESYLDEQGELDKLPSWLPPVDFERVWNYTFQHDFTDVETEGGVAIFFSNW